MVTARGGACRSCVARHEPPSHRILPPASGLPTIESMDIAIHHRPDAPELVRQIDAALARLVDE